MRTRIRSPEFKVTDPIREYIEKRVARLGRKASHHTEAEVSIYRDGDAIGVKIILHPGPLVAETSDRDLYKAVDLAADRMRGAVERDKAKGK